MHLALQRLRGSDGPAPCTNFHRLGLVKYGLASAAALTSLAAFALMALPCLLLLAAVAFYAVEAQMVFLFPVALDSNARPFREARRLTRRAGGTVAVMCIVVPIAAFMLLAGFSGCGFVRSWCLGCLAICNWYEELRTLDSEEGNGPRFPLAIADFRPLLVRTERVSLGLKHSLRLLYASDLHLGHRWTRRVPGQLLRAARDTQPDLILLGGDLADHAGALAPLRECVQSLTRIAPLLAVPGNHDVRAGITEVRAAVRDGGGHWLPDEAWMGPVRIDGVLDRRPTDRPRVLCTHSPGTFPAATDAGYRIVLAGHLHGGQCVLAEHKGLLYPAAWLYRWHGMRFDQSGTVMLVSRGAADSFPIRWNCPREVILCVVS
jgi:predicted MPP superfamily phosphohydrolase